MIRQVLALLVGASALILPACSSGGGGGSTPAVQPPFALDVQADRTTGSTNTTFQLTAAVLDQGLSLSSVAWDFGDNQTASGTQTSVSYGTPGFYAVSATARTSDGREQVGGLTITVMPASGSPSTGPGGTPLPNKIGDVDGDDRITLADAHWIVKHVRGIALLNSADSVLAADIDRDGIVNDHDVELISRTIALDTDLPESIVPATGAPGVRVNMISSHLLDPDALITFEIGAAPPFEPFRPLPGYATFLLPLTVQNADPLAPVTAEQIEVAIMADGQKVGSFDFDLVPTPTSQGDPIDETIAAVGLLRDQMRGLGNRLGELSIRAGVGAEGSAVIQALLLDAEDNIDQVDQQLGTMLRDLPPAARQAFGLYANANGLQDVLQGLMTQPEMLGSDDALIDSICSFLRIADKVGKLDDVLGTACAGLSIAALIPGPQQAVLVPLAGLCQGFSLATAAIGVINKFVPHPDNKLIVTSDVTSLLPNETANIRVKIRLKIAEQLCTQGLAKLQEYLLGQLTAMLMKRLPLAKAAHSIIKRYGVNQRTQEMRKDFLAKIRKAIQDLLGRVLNISGINSALENLQRSMCDWVLGSLDGLAVLKPQNLLSAVPAASGSISYPSETLAQFTCDPQATAGPVTIYARRMVCDKPLIGQVVIKCGDRGNVNICMGDNGALLDDIFEVRVDGVTFLTSSVPVRRVCDTIELTSGNHNVQMIGRAAPDGIGTYFIEFTGATVVSGPPLSGSNLSAGVTFTWVINVGTL